MTSPDATAVTNLSCPVCLNLPLLARVSLIVTDFDGVHTPNRAVLNETGEEMVQVNRSDGLGISNWLANAGDFLIISKEEKPFAKVRAQKLGVHCLSSVEDKVSALKGHLNLKGDRTPIAFLGNDVNDIPLLSYVDIPIGVQDSHPEVIPHCLFLTRRVGGR